MEKKQPFLNQVSIADQIVLDLAQDTFEGAFPDLHQLMACQRSWHKVILSPNSGDDPPITYSNVRDLLWRQSGGRLSVREAASALETAKDCRVWARSAGCSGQAGTRSADRVTPSPELSTTTPRPEGCSDPGQQGQLPSFLMSPGRTISSPQSAAGELNCRATTSVHN